MCLSNQFLHTAEPLFFRTALGGGLAVGVRVELLNVGKQEYRISCHMRQIDVAKQPPLSWLTFQQFGSEKEAYEYGLEKARAWIDEHEQP